jgi:co-chaperonin GroES (HSP10)
MKAIRQQVILQAVEATKTTASGIIVQGGTDEQTPATVVSCGNEVTEVREGDRVMIDWRHARPFKFNDSQYFTIAESNIIAVYQ